jgi:hypothetical protein
MNQNRSTNGATDAAPQVTAESKPPEARNEMRSPADAARSAWIPISEKRPKPDDICLITDGKDIGLSVYGENYGKPCWYGCGFGGYEWEWDFIPTQWMHLSVGLP